MKTDELWIKELKDSIVTYEMLKSNIALTERENQALNSGLDIPLAITPHLLHIIKNGDPHGAIRKQFIPAVSEMRDHFEADFLRESTNEIAPGLVQRYPFKAILLVTQACPAYCRFCTRSRIVGSPSSNNIDCALDYIKNHPEIYDIVITGGDPLILNNQKIEEIIEKIKEIKSVKVLRLNTRTPVNLPNRIDNELIKILKKHNVFVNIHFEHPDEISEQTRRVCLKMANSGILLGSQSVLLKGINDNEETLKRLFLELLKIKVKPYYLYQCDKVCGCESFYLPPEKGVELINRIAPQLPGIAVPKFVVDVPGKVGKSCIAPYGLVGCDDKTMIFKNYYTQAEEEYERETSKKSD